MKKKKYVWETFEIIYKGAPAHFIVCIILLVLIALFAPLHLLAINTLINMLTGNNLSLDKFLYPFLFFIFTLILTNSKSVINLLGSYLWITAEISLQKALIKKATNKTLSFYDIPAYYDQLERAKEAYGNAVGTTMMLISAIFISLFSMLFITVYLSQISLGVTIALLFISTIKVVSYIYETKNLHTLRIKQAADIRNKELLSNYIWCKESRVYGGIAHFLNKWSQKNESVIKENNKIRRKNLAFSFGMDSITFICYALALMVVVIVKLQNDDTVIADIIVLFVATDYIFNNISSIVSQFGSVIQNVHLSKDLFDFLNSETDVPIQRLISKDDENTISLENVIFRYPLSEKDTLNAINLVVKKGENIALVGENGSGKTTLVKILSGMYEPTKGIINYGKSLNLTDGTHKNISVMFQDVNSYNISLAENIIISDFERTYDAGTIEEILASVLGDQWLSKYPQGEKTLIGKAFGGTELSGGEKQKLSLGRMLFRKNTVLFLDEPTSALDPLAEEQIYRKFISISEGKTTFFTTHRLSTVRFADKIAVMKKGRIIEYGTYKELLSNNGEFAYLYNLQKDAF